MYFFDFSIFYFVKKKIQTNKQTNKQTKNKKTKQNKTKQTNKNKLKYKTIPTQNKKENYTSNAYSKEEREKEK